MIASLLLKNIDGYINGTWAGATSGDTFPVTNPATGEELAEVPLMGRDETTRAVEAAAAAQHIVTPLEKRRQWLTEIADILRANKQELGRIITLEQGKPWKEAQIEVEYAAGFYQYCAENGDKLEPHTLTEQPKGCEWTVYYRPAGVAGLITPWNFPIAMMAKKLSAAVLGDCACIMKPAEHTPLSLIAMMNLLDAKLDLPDGKINLVMGPAREIGGVLCEHPKVEMLSFTGSTEVGRLLIRQTADQVKKLALELGGNAPFFVFDDAELDKAADHLIANKFRAAGQTCVCANRVYVHKNVVKEFSEKVAERVATLKVGDGMEEGIDIGPLIDRQGFDKVLRHVQDALDKGARRITGEDPKEPAGEDWGCFFPPTVLNNVTHDMSCCIEETFGPVVPIIEFSTVEEAIEFGNNTELGLASYVFTNNEEVARQVIAGLRFGHVGYNTGTGPTPEAPFGGMKNSGFGREGGTEGLFEFVEPQTVPRAR
ncbi:MAG: NAD-dependent succinate-semialdehyde dehydrogenase [Gammaproteobacteria bacterium]|nr:NAD-dependent succinate-semialdehyde dehydrogenase [Gammaproteobacteria bacterium]